MKKLLVLSLVLGFASLATAGLSFTFDGSSILVSDDGPRIGGVDVGFGVIGNATLGEVTPITEVGRPSLPDSLTVTPYGDVSSMGYPWNDLTTVLWDQAVVDPFPAGKWITIGISGDMPLVLGTAQDYDVEVQVINGNFEVLESIFLSEVPEPATMALLGLGALVLRRKK